MGFLLKALLLLLFFCRIGFADNSIRSAQLDQVLDYSKRNDGLALLISHHNNLILEDYHNGSSIDTPQRIASIAKNLWAVLALAATDDGIVSLDEKLSSSIKEWQGAPGKKEITVRQLLGMRSGLSPGIKELYFSKPRNTPKTALRLPIFNPPGAVFEYGPSNMEIFGVFLRNKLKQKNPLKYLKERLLDPLGISYGEWKMDKAGNPTMSGGVKMTARDLLRFASFVMARGEWQGRELINSSLFPELYRTSSANPMYGLTFWLNTEVRLKFSHEVNIEEVLEEKELYNKWSGACISKDSPSDMLAMIGSGNQRVYILPSRELIIVRQGNGTSFKDKDFLSLLLN